jgi:hypothetical protein
MSPRSIEVLAESRSASSRLALKLTAGNRTHPLRTVAPAAGREEKIVAVMPVLTL